MIPDAPGLLKTLCIYMIAGGEELEVSRGLMHGGSSTLNSLDDALEKSQAVVDQGITAISDVYKNLQKQDALAKTCIQDAARVLRKALGHRWSQQGWPETGFPNQSTAVPATFNARRLLCRSLELYFKAHKARENEKLEVTEERAGDLYQAMKQAGKDVKKAEGDQPENLADRDKDKNNLRGGMQKLEGELALGLSSSDARWKKFGLEIPDAPSTPATPQDVAVDDNIPGKLLVTCQPVPGVNLYRFFQQTITDARPVLVGRSSEPMLLINEPAPGVALKWFVSARNLAGRESGRSQPLELKSEAA